MTLRDRSGPVRPVTRFTWVPVETAIPAAEASSGLRGRSIAIVGGNGSSAAAVAAALRDAGADARLVSPAGQHWTPTEIEESVTGFRAATGGLDGIVDLNLENPFDVTGPHAWEPALRQTLALLRSCYRDWADETDANRLFYLAVTRMGGRMGFAEARMCQPLGGIWAGLAKSLPREIPNCNVRILDLAPEHYADAPRLISRELYRWGLFEIGYAAGRRYTLVPRPNPVGAVTVKLRRGDVVVMSGGGRGIGFALARALAATFGCRVIVSGRAAPAQPGEPVLGMTTDAFRRHRAERLRAAAAARSLAGTRAELDRLARSRELWSNLSTVRAEGLDIEYHQCDITDGTQVAQLLDRAGDRLVGVVHNAGIDAPVRLPGKAPDVVDRVVRVKVAGFVNLVRALDQRPGVAFFCSVGSLTGRFGGMVGQLDYGAANEGLSRLGLWAAQPAPQPGRDRRLPVTTVGWPTWERLGMVTNYEAATRYMSALDVSEGLHHWQRELLAGGCGEVSFIGEPGPAMTPLFLRGFRYGSRMPTAGGLLTSRFFLGEPLRFRAAGAVSSVNVLRADTMPCCYDFDIDGEPALPLGLCLAYALSVGEWVRPEQPDRLELVEVRRVVVDLAALRLGSGPRTIHLVKDASGRQTDGAWLVSVVLTRRADGRERSVARAELVHRSAPHPPDRGQAALRPADAAVPQSRPVPSPAARLRWHGHVFRLTQWRRHPRTGRWFGQVDADRPEDLLIASPPPRPTLPLNQFENLARLAYRQQILAGGRPDPGQLTIDRLRIGPARDTAGRLSGDTDCRNWTGYDPAGRARLRVDGLCFQ